MAELRRNARSTQRPDIFADLDNASGFKFILPVAQRMHSCGSTGAQDLDISCHLFLLFQRPSQHAASAPAVNRGV